MDQEALIGVLSIDSAVLLVLVAESMSSGLIIKLLDDIYRMLWYYSDNTRRLNRANIQKIHIHRAATLDSLQNKARE
jgi:DNA polymerase III psi subunit